MRETSSSLGSKEEDYCSPEFGSYGSYGSYGSSGSYGSYDSSGSYGSCA